ncbi:hypothetical protein JRG78_08940 [Microbacterium sp. EF45047]|nr:hypothetical protein JRG78_08940 [Microbacterium sp. EF45047]
MVHLSRPVPGLARRAGPSRLILSPRSAAESPSGASQVPVIGLTGPLGAGKTTLLNRASR